MATQASMRFCLAVVSRLVRCAKALVPEGTRIDSCVGGGTDRKPESGSLTNTHPWISLVARCTGMYLINLSLSLSLLDKVKIGGQDLEPSL